MRHLGRFCAGIILALSLTLSAYAGHIPCGITGEPTTSEATAAGEIQNGVESTDAVTEVLLFILSLI
ncbi:MAG TPA: hypothetical protein VN256_15150 [Pyrinomonadaceae bacterium]|nr:hypothetical protein [Pyrinomonadaceae bacterium]